MKGSSGYSNPHQASCPANSERAPPSYEEIAGSSTQFGDAGKSLPTQFPPAYTEQEQNVRVVYLPAPNFGPKSAKVICSSCQVQCFFFWQMPYFNSMSFFRQLSLLRQTVGQVWWPGRSHVPSASPCCGPASASPSASTASRMWSTAAPTAMLPLDAIRAASRCQHMYIAAPCHKKCSMSHVQTEIVSFYHLSRGSNRRFLVQIIWVKSESNLICLSQIWVKKT